MATRNTTMNDLASYVDDFLYHGRYNKTDIGNQLGMSRQAFIITCGKSISILTMLTVYLL